VVVHYEGTRTNENVIPWDGFEKLGNFPGTVNAYRAWNAPQLLSPLLKISNKFGNGVARFVI
jgi:hypothetical protein